MADEQHQQPEQQPEAPAIGDAPADEQQQEAPPAAPAADEAAQAPPVAEEEQPAAAAGGESAVDAAQAAAAAAAVAAKLMAQHAGVSGREGPMAASDPQAEPACLAASFYCFATPQFSL